jgi:peptidoglycan/LPS O-acetylase OafA/YrhL
MEYSYLWGMPQLAFGTAFTRVPLNTFEGLRYLSITFGMITTTDVLWPFIGQSAFAAFVQTLGRRSLPVYVLHLWVVEAMGALAVASASMGAWQILFAVFSVLILWLFALILDLMGEPKTARHVPTPALPSIFRPESMAGAAR